MDTRTLHDRIEEYQSNTKNPAAKEMLNYFKDWLYAIENYITDLEWDNIEKIYAIKQQDDMIELLIKLLIITGNTDHIVDLRIIDGEKINTAVDFLFKNRVKNQNLHTIASLIDMAKQNGKNIYSMVDLVEYGRKN